MAAARKNDTKNDTGAPPSTATRRRKKTRPRGTTAERRAFRREAVVDFVWCAIIDVESDLEDREGPAEKWESIARSCDISEGGIRMVRTRPLAPGTVVMLEMALRKGNLSAVGRVAWSKMLSKGRFEAGIRFIALPPHDRIELRRYLNAATGRDEP